MTQERRSRIGELLKAAGLITEEQLLEALQEQQRSSCRLGEVLVQRGWVSELQVTQILSNQLSVAWVSLPRVDFSNELLVLIPAEIAEQYTLIPVHFRLGEQKQKILYVAMDDPTDVAAMEHVSRLTGMHVRPLIAPPSEIRRQIQLRYRSRG